MSESYKVYASKAYVDSKIAEINVSGGGGSGQYDIADDNDVADLLIQLGVCRRIVDENGTVLTDETGAVLCI